MGSMPLPVQSYELQFTPASTARLMNCHAKKLPPGAKTPVVIVRASGPKDHSTPGTGPIRGQHAFQGDMFVVSGTSLYKVESDATETLIGTIPGTGGVSMSHNVDYLVIVAEPNGYYSDGTTVAQITDPDFTSRGAKYVKFCDNYMLFMEPNSGRFFGADLNSVTSFDALDFATAESNPDDLVGMEVDRRQVVLLGEESGEIWENTGADGFPFERAINGVFEVGCFNGDTIAKLDNSVVWVANDYTVRKLVGATPQRISNDGVDYWLSSVDVSTLRAYAYSLGGGFFYLLCCSTGCFEYNAATNTWTERSTYPHEYFEWQYHCNAHGRQYVGNAYSNKIAYMDLDTFSDGGGIQRMEWTYQPVYSENKRAVHHDLEMVLDSGVGLTTGQGSDPEIMLAKSDDGGKTWTNLPNKKIGRMGEYTHRVRWTGLGSARQRVYRAAVSDPVRIAVMDTQLNATGARL